MHFYKKLREKYGVLVPVFFFLSGFLLDIFTVGRIDRQFTLYKHAFYLCVLWLILFLKVTSTFGYYSFLRYSRLQVFWNYRLEIFHFFIGSLLSAYMIFYFKSGSVWSSFIFLIILFFILVINEWTHFQKIGFTIQAALFSLCAHSYFIYLVPIVMGSMGWIPFLLSTGTAFSFAGVLVVALWMKLGFQRVIFKNILIPIFSMQVVIVLLYFLQVLPPVPLSLKQIGIYHSLEKKVENNQTQYHLFSEKPWWSFWTYGFKKFKARPGDRIYCFIKLFAPEHFKDKIFIRWMFYDEKNGWIQWDRIPMEIAGGREDGFRAFAFKENYQPGEWRVHVESQDGREIGRISFEVIQEAQPYQMRVMTEEVL